MSRASQSQDEVRSNEDTGADSESKRWGERLMAGSHKAEYCTASGLRTICAFSTARYSSLRSGLEPEANVCCACHWQCDVRTYYVIFHHESRLQILRKHCLIAVR